MYREAVLADLGSDESSKMWLAVVVRVALAIVEKHIC